MVLSSSAFIFAFFPVLVLLYYNPLIKTRTWRNVVLFIASLGFYAYGEPVYAGLLLLSITVNWGFGLAMGRFETHKKAVLWLAVLFNMGLLFWFKYINFFLESVGLLLNRQMTLIQISLPIGISFYSFQALSYLIDVYNGKAQVQKSWMKIGLYLSCFATVTSGPVVKYHAIKSELDDRRENREEIFNGLIRFSFGLAKKVIIANSLMTVADAAFAQPERTLLLAWEGMIAYTLQIYFDFAGYTDMALGMGAVFGLHLPENFNYPYIAGSINDFWRRWHISVTSWFREYIYFPLGGSRVSAARNIFNLFVVWLFTGLWHGASFNFIVWGLYYFVIQVLEKKLGYAEKMGKVFRHVYTMFFVMIGWVLFRAENMTAALTYIGQLFGRNITGITDGMSLHYLISYGFYFAAAILFSAPLYQKLKSFLEKKKIGAYLLQLALALLFVVSIGFVLRSEYDPFIYFNF